MSDHEPTVTTREADTVTTVRPTTRAAWNALREAGETPSVRKMHERLGGSYNVLADECKILRWEDAEAEGLADDVTPPGQIIHEPASESEPPETPVADPDLDDTQEDAPADEDAPMAASSIPATGTVPVREEAEQALRSAQEALRAALAKRERLNTTITEARQAYEAAQQTVREWQQRLLAEERVEAELDPAYQARTAAKLALDDWETQADPVDTEVAQAERAIGDADAALRLCHYNDLAAQRAELRASLEASLAQLETALAACVTHAAKQREAAKALGFDRLPGDIDAQNGHESSNGQGILNAFVYGRLSRHLKVPASNINPVHRLRVESLTDADVASIPLSMEQAQELTVPDRHRRASLPPNLHGPSYRNLLAVGIPALLFGRSYPLPVTAEQLTRMRRAGIPAHTA